MKSLVFFIFASGLVELVFSQKPYVCPSGWSQSPTNPRKCFFYNDARKSVNDARAVCKGLGANLASIESEEENEMLRNVAGAPEGEARHDVMLGGRNVNGKWEWEDGQPFEYSLISKRGKITPDRNRLFFLDDSDNWRVLPERSDEAFLCSKFLPEHKPEPEPIEEEDSCPADGGDEDCCGYNDCGGCC